jgi:hypothetical protein
MAAEGRAPLVDFCNRNDPRAQLRNRPNPAHHACGRPRAQLSSFHARVHETERGWPCFEAQPTEISRARGLRRLAPTRGFPPPRSLTVEASPQPDRPGHLMSRARDDAGRSYLHRRNAPKGASCYALADEPRLRRTRPQGRLTRPPAKEATIRRTRGAFHQRTTPRGAGSFPKTVPSLWIGYRAAFRSR